MIFDTDIFIWAQRGNKNAAKMMEKSEERLLSVQTYMELLRRRFHQLVNCERNSTGVIFWNFLNSLIK